MISGAQFEILVDGKARSYRNLPAVAIESADGLFPLMAHRVDSLRCEGSDAIGS